MTNISQKTEPPPESMGEFVRTIVFAVLIALVIRTFLFEPFNIPSSSMVPTLLVGDYLFVSKYSYGYAGRGTFSWGWGPVSITLPPYEGRVFENQEPKRGDVIVFKWPKDNQTDYIKRLIGLPGDHVQMKDGMLYINGKVVPREQLPEPTTEPGEPPSTDVTDYLEHLPDGPTHLIRKENGVSDPLDNTPEFIVPPHHYFMMGDNRDNSADSRSPTGDVGYVPEENLVGKARIIFFSLDEDTHFWEIWKWPWAIRWHRLFRVII
jgi:signal peptidase I